MYLIAKRAKAKINNFDHNMTTIHRLVFALSVIIHIVIELCVLSVCLLSVLFNSCPRSKCGYLKLQYIVMLSQIVVF